MYKTKLRDTWIGDATGSCNNDEGSEPLKMKKPEVGGIRL